MRRLRAAVKLAGIVAATGRGADGPVRDGGQPASRLAGRLGSGGRVVGDRRDRDLDLAPGGCRRLAGWCGAT